MKHLMSSLVLSLVAAGSAQAVPQHLPAIDQVANPATLYAITFYDDTGANHPQAATQNICFINLANVGTNTTGIWYSTTYNRWIGRWRQEGDQIFMVGDFWTGKGNDAMQIELVTTKDEGFGHWEEWVEDGYYGWWPGKGNTRIAKIGGCAPFLAQTELAMPLDLSDIEQAALREAEAAPIRYRRDGSLAQPADKDQVPLK